MNTYPNKTILIADDNSSGLRYLQACLQPYKVNTVEATNGKGAIDIYKKKKIDLTLMDIGMPIIGGFEAAKRILAIDPDAPIIIQSAYSMNNEREESLMLGAVDYLSKPIDRKKLEELLEKYLG